MNRDLGGSEKNYWIANQFSTNNVVSVLKGEGKIATNALLTTLQAIQQRHPSLQIHVIADTKGEKPRIIQQNTPHIPMEYLPLGSAGIPASIFREQLEKQLNTSLDYEHGPLCRTVFIDAKEHWCLLICCSHMISDATSVMILAEEILMGISLLENQQKLEVIKLSERPPLEDCFPVHHQGIRTLPLVLTSQMGIAWQQMQKKPVRMPSQKNIPFIARKNKFLQKMLRHDVITTLIGCCKKEGTSIHGILTAALALSIAKELKSQGLLTSDFLGIGSPVDFREDLPINVQGELGTYICTLFSFVDITLDEWNLARAINNEIQARYEKNEHFASLNLLKWLAPKSKVKGLKLVEYIDRKGPGNICVSNIGVYEFKREYGSLSLSSAEWFASMSVTGLLLMSVNTSLGCCHLNFTYIDQAVPERTVMNIASNVEKLLHGLTNK